MALSQYEQFLDEHKVVENTKESRQIVSIGERIAMAAQKYYEFKGAPDYLKDYAWEYNLVQDPKRNTWCMPGGKIVFYTSILPVAANKDSLVAIMGHEVAHALLDHGGQRMKISLAQQGLNIIAINTTENQPEKKRRAILTAYRLGSTVGDVLPFSRKHEKEVDQIGLELMAIARFNPEEAPRLWERMKAASGGKAPPEILSTHPSNERRINDLTKWMPLAKKRAQEINGK
jgi:predicted Zn-dependent protease|tara:strand:- start:688 stop:1380 length:693 start_codon:yes stop_codon:yes gene_type:complete